MFDLPSLYSAFEIVKENHGCAGVDGITIEIFEKDLDSNLRNLQKELTTETYAPLPLIKILVDKGNGEARALHIPAVRDRTAQTSALNEIGPFLEAQFEECSFAYRKNRSVRQAVYKVKEYYDKGYCWVVNADIDAFFDSVNHEKLLDKVKRFVHDPFIQGLIELWVKAEIWDGKTLKALKKGIPQGSPISPILANLFLDELDEALLRKGYKIVRYADNFLILCKKPKHAQKALELSKNVLESMLLKLDEEDIVNFEQGFKYLGVIFIRSMIMTPFDKPKRDHKVLFYPDPLNLDAYLLKRRKGW